tara:strand:- start:3895 stop:4359 length:465 start_codon:yes stop_codon:yes gene_type:complete
MEILVASAAAIVVGLFTGQFVTIGLKGNNQDPELSRRVQAVEKVIPDLISRTEVQDVINKVPPLVAQQVQSEITDLATRLQPPQQQLPPQMPPMPPAYEELTRQNQAKMQELEARIQEASTPIQQPPQGQMNMNLPQMEALQKQMKPRNRKPRQ